VFLAANVNVRRRAHHAHTFFDIDIVIDIVIDARGYADSPPRADIHRAREASA
jgi:hypothetical protein